VSHLDWPAPTDGALPLLIAHRGASGTRPENTEAAFRGALAAGVRTWECDVRLTRDGVPVVLHDAHLERTTDGKGFVREVTLADLRKISAGYRIRFGEEYIRQRVPTLEETMRLARDEARLLIEIKTDGGDSDRAGLLIRTVVDQVAATGAFYHTALISFDPAVLVEARRLSADVITGLLVGPMGPAGAAAKAAVIGARFLIPARTLLNEPFCQAAREASLVLASYSIDDPAQLALLRPFGLYAVATDFPERFIGSPEILLA